MGEWSFCETCGWHSTGKAVACPNCASGIVRHLDEDLLMDAKGEFHSSRETKEKPPSVDTVKEKAKSA